MEPYLTTAEAAEYVNLSVSRVRQLVTQRKIPFHRRGKGARLGFKPSELDAWMRGEWQPNADAA